MKIPNLSQDPSGQTWLLQTALNSLGYALEADNWRGPRTEKALSEFQKSLFSDDWLTVTASSFADPADVAAFHRCKTTGRTDMECFAVGDNGIGLWQHNTAQDMFPMCALPREIWQDAGKTGGAGVLVRYNGIVVHGILGDTMPSLANIRTGAGIDLNPAFSKHLGLHPPFLVSGVEWRWA